MDFFEKSKQVFQTNFKGQPNNLIQQFQYLKDGGFIQNKFYLLKNNNETIQVNKFTRELINYTKQLIFYKKM